MEESFFNLQHDVTDLAKWSGILTKCDVVFASRRELLELTEAESEEQAVGVMRRLGVDTIVMKYGIGGSCIYPGDELPIRVPSYEAGFRCTIGAGDVYNAIFSLGYREGTSLSELGSTAAVAASVFIENVEFDHWVSALSRLDAAEEKHRRLSVVAPPEELSQIQLYVAGHFLSTPMREWVDRVANALEAAGFSTFSPWRDAGILRAQNEHAQRRDCFMKDLEALNASRGVVALLDGLGRGGTSWELGYAYAKDIPIYGLLTDQSKPCSNMVAMSCRCILSSLPDLLNYLFYSPDRLTSGDGKGGMP